MEWEELRLEAGQTILWTEEDSVNPSVGAEIFFIGAQENANKFILRFIQNDRYIPVHLEGHATRKKHKYTFNNLNSAQAIAEQGIKDLLYTHIRDLQTRYNLT